MLKNLRDFIRPIAVAALIGTLLIGAITSGILEVFLPGKGVAFTVGVAGWFRAIPDAYYQLTGAIGGLFIVAREMGKVTAAKSTGTYGPVDTPEGGA